MEGATSARSLWRRITRIGNRCGHDRFFVWTFSLLEQPFPLPASLTLTVGRIASTSEAEKFPFRPSFFTAFIPYFWNPYKKVSFFFLQLGPF